MDEFARGPYGELLLPPQVAGATAEDIWKWFADRVGRSDAEVLRVQHGSDSTLVLAMAAFHNHRLAQVVGGDARTPDEERVRDAVLGGESVSLRPITLEDSDPPGFAPVFRYLGDDRWRTGKEGAGRTEVFEEPDRETAVRRAHRLYVEWQEQLS